MKKIRLISVTIAMSLFVFTGCDRPELPYDNKIEGIYVGTITSPNGQSKEERKITEDAMAEITKIGNLMIEVHLFNSELDTTLILNYYDDMNFVRVCFTGDDFETAYGHRLSEDHISRGMMGHIQNNETEWMHHLNDEHQGDGDEEHFGEFDIQDHSFRYRFDRMVDGITTKLEFQGTKL
ncbi:hypothetical protein ACA086_08470 [Muriicola sp. E247]|uniref:hypothetical protein n=1 Tax=Muriicola sp. E247 TaxID=3242730 RepID=UPI003524A48F